VFGRATANVATGSGFVIDDHRQVRLTERPASLLVE
jgi:hypothetical protein